VGRISQARFQRSAIDGENIYQVNAIYTHEAQNLNASALLGASRQSDSLNDFRADLSYYWHNMIGGAVGYFNTRGTADPTLYVDSSPSSRTAAALCSKSTRHRLAISLPRSVRGSMVASEFNIGSSPNSTEPHQITTGLATMHPTITR